MSWTSEQIAVIERAVLPTVVIASPGSGKTSVLTKHIEYILQHHAVAPSKIAAVTFTRQAAEHMRAKLKGYRSLSNGVLESLRIGTFHALMFKAALQEKSDIPLLLNHREQQEMMGRALESTLSRNVRVTKQMVIDCLTRYAFSVGRQHCKNGGFTRKLFARYNELKAQNNRWDYDDILIYAAERLCSLRDFSYLSGLRYMLVDEFQDTNALQWIILSQLRDRFELPIFVVGDDDQSIYGFRGASPQFLRATAEGLRSGKSFLLTYNFRSDIRIVEASSKLISYGLARVEKPLRAVRNDLGEVFGVRVASSLEQTQCVLRILLEYAHSSSTQSVGILARTRRQLHPVWRKVSQTRDQDILSKMDIQFRTFHDSKGKEWDLVILLDLVRDRRMMGKDLNGDILGGDIESVEEERRLHYVAMTRARHILIAVAPDHIGNFNQELSPFLAEAHVEMFRYRPSKRMQQ